VKRAAWLRSLPDKDQNLLVDTGDILDVEPDQDLSREILEVYTELGYDAVVVGDQEFSNGVQSLRAYRDKYPLLAHNLALCDEKSCLFFSPEPAIVSKNNERVGLIALLDPEIFRLYPQELLQQLKLEEPEAKAAALVQQLQAQGVDWIVVLYHGSVERAEKLAALVPGIHLLLVGHEQRLLKPRRLGATILASAGEDGNRVGVLGLSRGIGGKVRFTHSFQEFAFERDPDDPAVRRRIEDYRKRLREALGG